MDTKRLLLGIALRIPRICLAIRSFLWNIEKSEIALTPLTASRGGIRGKSLTWDTLQVLIACFLIFMFHNRNYYADSYIATRLQQSTAVSLKQS